MIVDREPRGDEDYWAVRRLLVETYSTTPPEWNWEVRRWDGWRYYRDDPAWDASWNDTLRIWEDGPTVVGAVHLENTRGLAYVQLRPAYRRLENDMFAWAESQLSAERDGRRVLETFVYDYDIHRRSVLDRRDYAQQEAWGVVRRLRIADGLPDSGAVPDGYRVRSTLTGDREDAQRLADLVNAAFGRSSHTADELLVFHEHAPSYAGYLELVAEATDGSFAALAAVNVDEENGRGIFEPVCTHPDHRGRGLAMALMREGMHRAAATGLTDLYVGTGDQGPANRLYDKAGFTEIYRGHYWRKDVTEP